MIDYVCGLCFNEADTKLLLIQKKHGPENLLGKWNGVGGKVEPGEQPSAAMTREFQEETGVVTGNAWVPFLLLCRPGEWRVHFYHTHSNEAVNTARTTTDEVVGPFLLSDLPVTLVLNLNWIIPMAMHHIFSGVDSYAVTEVIS
jgi:8-oxo-dGTP diphosphatase